MRRAAWSVTVHYCPNGEASDASAATARYRFSEATTFLEVLREASAYFREDFDACELKNELGQIWDPRDVVNKIMHREDEDSLFICRLCRRDTDVKEEEEEEGPEAAPPEEEVEDRARPPTARRRVPRELITHCAYLGVLLALTYATVDTERHFDMLNAMKTAFLKSHGSLIDLDDVRSDNTFEKTQTFQQQTGYDWDNFMGLTTHGSMCAWLNYKLPYGLFASDITRDDASGSVMAFNRLVGGVSMTMTTEPWRSAAEAWGSQDLAWPWKGPNLVGDATPSGAPPQRRYGIELRPEYVTGGWLLNQSLIFYESFELLLASPCRQQANVSTNFAEWWPPDALRELTSKTELHSVRADEVLRRLEISALFYNHNKGLYARMRFSFDLDPGGLVRPWFSFQPYDFFDLSGGLFVLSAPAVLAQLQLWLSVCLYGLIGYRTFVEVRAARRVRRAFGSYRYYFGSVFSWLELANLGCSYANFFVKLTFAFHSGRREFLDAIVTASVGPPDVMPEVEGIRWAPELFAISSGLRAIALTSACLISFNYLELAPKGTTFYLTGTTFGRAGRDVKFVTLIAVGFVMAYAIIGHLWLGTHLDDFCTWPQSFLTLLLILAGWGGSFRQLGNTPAVEGIGKAYFVGFTLIGIAVVTSFFLAVINDAYAVRMAQLLAIRERRQTMLKAKRTNAATKRTTWHKRGGTFDKKRFAVKSQQPQD